MNSLEVEIINKTGINDQVGRSICQCFHGRILYTSDDEEIGDSDNKEIGEIIAYRLFGDLDQVLYWADEMSVELFRAVAWLTKQDPLEVESALFRGCLYLEKAVIQPQWRGKVPTLRATATFIEGVIHDGFVFLEPSPIPYIEADQARQHHIIRLKKFWGQLGISNYDEDHNILWHPEWMCPAWLAGE